MGHIFPPINYNMGMYFSYAKHLILVHKTSSSKNQNYKNVNKKKALLYSLTVVQLMAQNPVFIYFKQDEIVY